MFATYEEGKADLRLPTPWLNAMKSSIDVLEVFANLELLEPELARLRREVSSLAAFMNAFSLPQTEQLERAAEALKGW